MFAAEVSDPRHILRPVLLHQDVTDMLQGIMLTQHDLDVVLCCQIRHASHNLAAMLRWLASAVSSPIAFDWSSCQSLQKQFAAFSRFTVYLKRSESCHVSEGDVNYYGDVLTITLR
jgi:hypothetical protein